MLLNYLRVAARNLRNYAGYYALNVLGLAVGIACCFVMLFYIQDELSYDRFNEHAEDTYRLILETDEGQSANLHASVGENIAAEHPDVRALTRLFTHWEKPLIAAGESGSIEDRFFFADPSFFDVFSLEVVSGNAGIALDEPFAVLLSESTAARFYGDEDPVGKTLSYNSDEELTVAGVYRDAPHNAHFHPDFIASMATLPLVSYEGIMEEWSVFQTYVVANEGTTEAQLVRTANNITARFQAEGSRNVLRAQPLTSIHLHSHLPDELEANSDIRYVRLLGIVGILILLIACINYTNLATARSLRRAREVGVRKAVGASRRQLVMQFLGESMVVTAIALVTGLFLVWILSPVVSGFAGKPLSPGRFPLSIALGSTVLLLGVSLLAGSYPAAFLSRFRPRDILASSSGHGPRKSTLRQSLVVAQFTASLVLIIGTLIVFRQLDFVQEARLGFNKEHVIALPAQDDGVRAGYETLEDRLLANANVLAVGSTSSSYPGRSHGSGHRVVRADIADAPRIPVVRNWVNDSYLDVLEVDMLAGRSFSDEFSSDENAVVLNEAAIRDLGFDNPEDAIGVDVVVNPGSGAEERRIVGVTSDFNYSSLHSQVAPLILTPFNWPTHILVRVTGSDMQHALATVEGIWASFTTQPFAYSFIDAEIDRFYRTDAQWGRILFVASLLAVFIACLGLFGLAAFTAESRTKEISIRKVLGASAAGIVSLLSRDFLKLVALALLFATPVAYVLMDRWLENFAYRVDMHWSVFAVAGAAALAIAFATVSYQAVKAATMDPVRAFRQ